MKNNLVMTAAVVALTFTACKNSDFEGYTKADNGLHYKFFNQDEAAPKATEGEAISIRYTLKKQSNDSLIFDSKNSSPDGINRLGLDKSRTVGGIEDALKMMAKGDSASFIFSSDSFFLKTNGYKELPPFVKPGEHLALFVKMVDIKTKKEVEENQKMQMEEQAAKAKVFKDREAGDLAKYIADNKITTKPTASGLIYMEVKKGSGPNPKNTEILVVNYSGTLLDGTPFDSSEKAGQPLEFGLGVQPMMPGFEEALKMMKKGGKAKVILPSALAYGDRGRGEIYPYAPVVFELELLDIKPAAAPVHSSTLPGQ